MNTDSEFPYLGCTAQHFPSETAFRYEGLKQDTGMSTV